MKKETAIIVEIKLYELVDYSISYGSLECELVDCSLFLLVALLFARIWKISRKDNYCVIQMNRCWKMLWNRRTHILGFWFYFYELEVDTRYARTEKQETSPTYEGECQGMLVFFLLLYHKTDLISDCFRFRIKWCVAYWMFTIGTAWRSGLHIWLVMWRSWVWSPSRVPVVSSSKKLYPYCSVLVGSRNGFERAFTIKLK